MAAGEWRRARPAAADFAADAARFAADKESIILVSHDASRTGAPILALNIGQRLRAKYNVITILLRGGELAESFKEMSSQLICFADKDRRPVELKHAVRSILRDRPVRYAIVNSITSYEVMPALAGAFIPTITLIHEFSSHAGPLKAVHDALIWTTEPVFSTELAADSFRKEHPALLQGRVHILPQGPCMLPASKREADEGAERRRLETAMRPPGAEDALVVLGAGSVHIRKGVDLFLASAAAALRLGGKRPVRFVWIGGDTTLKLIITTRSISPSRLPARASRIMS